ncbi:hypothetical protein CDAR_174331 [Caerostris darwini]|uniref:Uncharacterized protein n=1 Tax=Caerostris darwini TaxID=1538125 RepID=A0AAV4VIB3_9ARAC|nr:hypothetical protein CDAR_174331 [Caerostris darwini]
MKESTLPRNHRLISITCHVRVSIPRKRHPQLKLITTWRAPAQELESPPMPSTSWEEASPDVVRYFLMANKGRARILLGGSRMLVQTTPCKSHRYE